MNESRRKFLQKAGLGLVGLTVSSFIAAHRRYANKEEHPNVLFITVDDLNHWCGYMDRNSQVKTPNIDRLSKMGVSFTNAHCPAPACEPSRTAFLSGMRPSTSGCYRNGHSWKQYVPEGISLNATFRKFGYYVMGVGKTYHNSARMGISSVYTSEWDEYPPLAKPANGDASKYQGYFQPMELDIKDEDLGDWHSVDYCLQQLTKKHDKPFFLACGLIKPHLAWAVPQKYYNVFPLDKIELPPYIENDLSDIPRSGRKMGNKDDHPKFLKSGRWKNAVQSYLATIAYVDVCIGRLLDGLEKSAYLDNTVIVLLGDHGWHLGEKKRWRKFTLWEEATRAPMIWVAPGITKANSLCHQPVDFMCIYPTLCELVGLKIPNHVEGRSIVPLLKNPNAEWDGVALTTNGYMNHSVRTSRWRYIHYADGSEELYDHMEDPYEWVNLAENPAYAREINKLSSFLPKSNAKMKPKTKEKINSRTNQIT